MISQKNLLESDPAIAKLLAQETERKEYGLELIPSENSVSEAVLEVCGSIFTDKYAEGYPGKRYYGGCVYHDEVEELARQRAMKLFGADCANVQPHSGANANMAVYFALINIGDTILGPRLDHGGHLTHGSPVNFSGKWYNVVSYGVHPETHLFDEDEIRRLAREHKPKLIMTGATAYSRQINWKMFREIADEVGAYLVSDVSHYAGLIVGGAYESPVPYADVVTTTTHKTLRGPRGGLILPKKEHFKAINKAVFPGLQGGPLMHQIAGKAVAFNEALQPEFSTYAKAVVANARALSDELQKRDFSIVSGGTDSHVMIIDLSKADVNGAEAEEALGKVGITVNKNTVPNDPRPASVTSGIRIGTPCLTTRGFEVGDMADVAQAISDAINWRSNESQLKELRGRIIELCKARPLFPYRLKK